MDDPTSMQYRVLGPLMVGDGGTPMPLGGPKQRLVLALLLVQPDRVVHVERLVDGVWEEEPPASAERINVEPVAPDEPIADVPASQELEQSRGDRAWWTGDVVGEKDRGPGGYR